MPLFKRKQIAPAPAAAAAPPALAIDKSMGDPGAARLQVWLAQRSWRATRDFLTAVYDPDDRAFYVSACADVDGVQEWIDEWLAAEPHSTLPLLVRGAHAVNWAWHARGGKTADHTSQDQFREFFRRLRLAENCLDEVVERDPDDTTAWAFLIRSARGRQVDRAEAQRRFDAVVKRRPHHRMAHEQMLQYLCKKWFGSHEEMFDFARSAATKAPAGSPLGALVATAHIERWLDLPSGDDVAYMTQPEVIADLRAAADASVRHPYFRRRPGWPALHNTFAFAFACAGDWAFAAEQFDMIGDRVTEWPWQYFRADAASAFLELREDAYRNHPVARRGM
jgi:hypothetical protein